MQRLTLIFALTSALVLGLAALPAAPSASAIFDCVFCTPADDPEERCIGNCNGVGTLNCGDYVAAGCGYLVEPQVETKEEFLASLNDTERGLGLDTDGDGNGDATRSPDTQN